MKEKTMRLLSLLLTAVMLVTAQGFTTLADTVSQDNAQNISAEGQAGSGQASIPEGADASENPVHHCTKDNTTDWSYIYFGSYPQSEVTDPATIKAIDSAIAAESAEAGAETAAAGDIETLGTDADALEAIGIDVDALEADDGADTIAAVGTDVELGNVKYRRISKEDANHEGHFGGKSYRYFKWEPIKWRVLDNNDDGTLFVVADRALDCENYNDELVAVTWENSKIRSWLNGSFYQNAFNSAEQSAIMTWNVVNENSPQNAEGGNNTTDNVYLLSLREALNGEYGFCNYNMSKYSASRQIQVSEYADARGSWRISGSGYERCSKWWLRSPGSNNKYAVYVDGDGRMSIGGCNVNQIIVSVVPALHIKLSAVSSGLWSVEGNSSSVAGGDIPANSVHHCIGDDTTDWSYIWFGSYPQSEVTDSKTTAAIDSAIAAGNAAAGADVGMDVWVDGTKYRRIHNSDCNDNFDKAEEDGCLYFKWEPIKWRVLCKDDDSTLLVMADRALDCKCYNDEQADITWENSAIRSWLNGSFYQMAFSSEEQSAITPWHVVNEDNPDDDTEGGNDTTDYVYLLSIGEVTSEKYGFCSDSGAYSPSRCLQTGGYAQARGAGRDAGGMYEDSCSWWLRSSGGNSEYAACVADMGYVSGSGSSVITDTDGVAPVLHIKIQTPPNPDPQPTGTRLTASQVTSRTDTVPQGASFTVTCSDPANPTVSFDGVSDENVAAVMIPKTITYNGVEYKVTTVSPTSFISKKHNARFTVTDNRVESLTVEYKAVANAKKTKAKTSVPKSVTYKGIKFKVTSVAAKAFKKNKKVKQVSIAASITKIGDSCFEGCTNLKSVTLGKGVTTIGKNAFKNCKKLAKITIKSAKLKKVGKNALKGVNAKCKIKVPKKQLKKYRKLFKKKGQKSSVKLVK